MPKLPAILNSALLSMAVFATVSCAADEQDATPPTEQAPVSAATPADTPDSDSAATDAAAQPQAEQNSEASAPAAAEAADPYAVQSFFADFTHFAIGDSVPELYRSKKYTISQWKVRNLPQPQADSHWTYMGGNYVLIGDADGKILKAESGEIFYKQ